MRLRPLALLLSALLAGCGASYSELSNAFRNSLSQGDLDGAQKNIEKAMGVGKNTLPSKADKSTVLLLLERGTVLQAQGDYKNAARDFGVADQNLEVVDLTTDAVGTIEKYIFSDDSKLYKSPPYEKLLLSTMNMINYLAMDDLQGAKVEARRLVVNKKYLESLDEPSMLALGSYLAGVAFESAGEYSTAMHHYADAYEAGGLPTLTRAIQRLYQKSAAKDARLTDVVRHSTEPLPEGYGEVVIVVQSGIAPHKVAVREHVGSAMLYASEPGPGVRLTSKQSEELSKYAAKSALKWVNYPALVVSKSNKAAPTLTIDGEKARRHLALDVESKVIKHFESIRGSLVASSLTRLLSRTIAAETSEALAKSATSAAGGNKETASLLGLLIGLATEGAMVAADTPDTRSWVTLPARFELARYDLPAGQHVLKLQRNGQSIEITLNVQDGGLHLVNFSAIR